MNLKLRIVLATILLIGLAVLLTGCSLTLTSGNEAPQANFTLNKKGDYAPLEVNFHSTASDDEAIITQKWSFGDGSTAQGKNASHVYQDDGIYQVSLTVTDDDGATNSCTTSIEVLNPSAQPQINFTPDIPVRGELVKFSAKGSFDPASMPQPQYIQNYYWDFGDGTTGSGITTKKAYTQPGYYDVTLSLRDDDGARSSVTKEIEVEAPPKAAYYWKVKKKVCNGQQEQRSKPEIVPVVCEAQIEFTSTSYDPHGEIISYRWDFGDGTESRTRSRKIRHWYPWNETGYEVTLRVKDDFGLTDQTSKEIHT